MTILLIGVVTQELEFKVLNEKEAIDILRAAQSYLLWIWYQPSPSPSKEEEEILQTVQEALQAINFKLDLIFSAGWTFLELTILAEKLEHYHELTISTSARTPFGRD
jgi:hypothetical protein